MRNGIHVLAATRRLEVGAQRRVLETAQLVMDVLRKGGLTDPNGQGIPAAQKVRLLHASIRHLILEEVPEALADSKGKPRTLYEVLKSIEYDPKTRQEKGYPINQEDLAYTLMTFSHVSLRGLKALRAEVTPEEAEAFIHCWNVVGSLLGIRDELLPPTADDARQLFEKIKQRQAGSTDEGQAMQKALLALLQRVLDQTMARAPGWLRPSWLARDLPAYLTGYCLDQVDDYRDSTGRSTSDLLAVLPVKTWRRYTFAVIGWALTRAIRAVKHDIAGTPLGHASRLIHMAILEEMARLKGTQEKRLFNLPDALDAGGVRGTP